MHKQHVLEQVAETGFDEEEIVLYIGPLAVAAEIPLVKLFLQSAGRWMSRVSNFNTAPPDPPAILYLTPKIAISSGVVATAQGPHNNVIYLVVRLIMYILSFARPYQKSCKTSSSDQP